MKKIEALLICNSNMFVPIILTEILANPRNNYLVISDTENINKFFKFLGLSNIVYYQYGFNPKEDGFFGFVRRKKDLLGFVSQYEIARVVFFHSEFGDMANWLIKKLSRSIPIYYSKVYDSLTIPSTKSIFKRIKIQMIQLLYWGVKVDVLEHSYPFPSLPKSFFTGVKAHTICMPINREIVGNCLHKRLLGDNIIGKYVLLTGSAIRDHIYTVQEYEPFINQLIETLGTPNVLSKCHPRYSDLYGKERDLVQVPSFIPGNVLLNNFEYYIGVESTLLVEAAQANKKAISIIDWLQPKEELRRQFHAFLENRLQGKGKIYFPKSMEEFVMFLSSENEILYNFNNIAQ